MTSERKTVSASLQVDRGYYVVRGRVFNPNTGKTQQRSKSTKLLVKGNNKRKALQMLKEITAKWEAEANSEAVLDDPLFSECVREWFCKKAISLKSNTLKSYEVYATKYINPKLGNIEVRNITLKILQNFYTELLKYISVSTVKKINVVVSGALLECVRNGIITTNYADYVEFPKAKKFEGKAYTAEQVQQLLTAVKVEKEPIYSAVVLGVCYGLRRSEICGLRWQDIDFNNRTMQIRNTVTDYSGLRIEEEHTKTLKSRRTIALIESTIPYLLELKKQQSENGLTLDKVCRWTDGKEVRPDFITRKLNQIMERNGLPVIRLHDLRHTSATLLATKVSAKQVQEFLGHSNISTTMDIYTHLLNENRKETSTVMNDILKSAFSVM